MKVNGEVSKNGSCVLKVSREDEVFVLNGKPSPLLYKTKEFLILRPVKTIIVKRGDKYYQVGSIEKRIVPGLDCSGLSNADIRKKHGFTYEINLMEFVVKPNLGKYTNISNLKLNLKEKK